MAVVRARLAPSPTGGLHVGNVRTLMLAWLSARAVGGIVVLRVEDLDRDRCKPGFTEQMIADLRWLGFDWDEGPATGGSHGPYRQSQRYHQYESALQRLIDEGRAYPCTCSRAELAQIAGAPHGSTGPTYPGTCRDRYRDAAEARRQSGREPAWRFDLRRCPKMPWQDCFTSDQPMPAAVDDFVLRRADGVPAYQLAVVVDDMAMGITEVVRGADLADSTPRQLALIAALRGKPPAYFHVPLVLDDQGRRLAKRSGSTQIAELRDMGVRPEPIVGLLARGIGLNDTSIPARLDELVGRFSWDQVPRDPVTVHESDLNALLAPIAN